MLSIKCSVGLKSQFFSHKYVGYPYQRSNRVLSDFTCRVCDSSTLDSLHKTYCMHMYGCELWDLNCNYVKNFKVAWWKIKRHIWRLPYRAHNAIVHQLSYDIDHQLETRMLKFVHLCLNHSNASM